MSYTSITWQCSDYTSELTCVRCHTHLCELQGDSSCHLPSIRLGEDIKGDALQRIRQWHSEQVIAVRSPYVPTLSSCYLELSSLCEEVSEQHQHVWGHRCYVGSVGVGSVSVAKASSHGVVHEQQAGSLNLREPTQAQTYQHRALQWSKDTCGQQDRYTLNTTVLPSWSFWALGPCSEVQPPQSSQSQFLIHLVHPRNTDTSGHQAIVATYAGHLCRMTGAPTLSDHRTHHCRLSVRLIRAHNTLRAGEISGVSAEN